MEEQIIPAIAIARGETAPSNLEVIWDDISNPNLPFYSRLKAYDKTLLQWRVVTQLPLELLNELKKVDGDGSGLDANFLQGRTVNDIIQLAKDGSFALPSGFIFVGNTSGNATPRALSGDATLQPSGALILASSGVVAGAYSLATFTVDAKGRVTNVASYTIQVSDIPQLPQSKITNLVTDLGNRELIANKENSVIDTNTTKYPTVNLLKTGLDGKQATLVSGTNIKTVNGTTILGSGDIPTPDTNIGNANQTIPAATNRTLTLPADSTLAFGNLIKLFGSGNITQILPSAYPSDADIPIGQVAYRLNTGKVEGRYRVDASNYLDISFGSNLEIYNGTDLTPLTAREKIRFSGYLEAVDDAVNSETDVDLSSTALKESNVNRFGVNPSDEVDLKIAQNKLLTGDINGFATELTGTEGSVLGFGASNEVQEFEAIEVFNILKEQGITANKTMALVDISNIASNLKAKFAIFSIVAKNNTANAVTINIGSTSLGTDIVNAGVVGASSEVRLTVGTSFFSTTTGTNLFISSALWNSANIDIHIQIQKVWQ